MTRSIATSRLRKMSSMAGFTSQAIRASAPETSSASSPPTTRTGQ